MRGLGIVDVRHIFGIRAVRQQKRIEVQVELEQWDSTRVSSESELKKNTQKY
jgi:HPr kinase/phosphorylase